VPQGTNRLLPLLACPFVTADENLVVYHSYAVALGRARWYLNTVDGNSTIDDVNAVITTVTTSHKFNSLHIACEHKD